MREYTNLAWPDQPFGAGQRPFAVPAPMLAALAIQWISDGDRAVPVCATIAYLRLHRTRPVPLTDPALQVGFRTSLVGAEYQSGQLVTVVDADLSRCRRHAAVFAAHSLVVDLGALRALDPGRRLRGLTEIENSWGGRTAKARDLARMFDIGLDVFPGRGHIDLGTLCRHAGVPLADPPLGLRDRAAIATARSTYLHQGDMAAGELTALANLQQAITIALIAAAALERGTTQPDPDRPIDLDELVFRIAWDCFPHLRPEDLPRAATVPPAGTAPP